MKRLIPFFLFIGILFRVASARADFPVVPRTLPDGYLSGILEMFPESREVAPALLDFHVDPNIRLFREAELFVTFLHEGASLKNRFGYFLYQDADGDGDIQAEEITETVTVFSEVSSREEGGTLAAGDTVSLGKFPAGTRLGFFLHSSGFALGSWTFYTIDSLNHDAHRHLAMRVTPDGDNIALGIEDLPWTHSDRDFNDIMFSITTEPKSALQEIIDEGNIPGPPTPSPSPFPTPTPTPTPSPHSDMSPCTDAVLPSAATPATEPDDPKIFELPEAQASGPGAMLEGGGMFCSLADRRPTASPGVIPWLAASLLVSYLAVRLMRLG